MKKRLQTVLSHAGVTSRRKAAELIESGKVSVDGSLVTEKGKRVDPERQKVTVDGRPLEEEKKCYFLFNKPRNVISTVTDTHGRKKVVDYFRKIKARLYPVGRLDRDTTGLLVITNDGDLAHRLSHPKFEIEKEYLVTVDGSVRLGDVRKLKKGVELDGKTTAPCEVEHAAKDDGATVMKVVLHEGRKRQLRRMFEVLGYKVTALKRVKYAGLTLGRLKEGEYRELTDSEVARLRRKIRD